MANSRKRSTTGAEQRGHVSGGSPGSSSTGREHRGDSRFDCWERRRWRPYYTGAWRGPPAANTTGYWGGHTTDYSCELSGTAASAAPTDSFRTLRPSRRQGAKAWKLPFDNGDFCSREPWPDNPPGASRSGWWTENSSGGKIQARDAQSRIGWIVSRTTSKRSEPQTALRWTIGSHSELTEPYGPLRRRWTMGRRGTRGCCRVRKSSWPPGTRKKRRPADDVRPNGTLVILSPPHICR